MAYRSLFDLASFEKGETFLIQPAAEGVDQATILLDQKVGAKIFATVGSKEKRVFIPAKYEIPYDRIVSSRKASFAAKLMAMTKRNGIYVVETSLAGPLLQAILNSIT